MRELIKKEIDEYSNALLDTVLHIEVKKEAPLPLLKAVHQKIDALHEELTCAFITQLVDSCIDLWIHYLYTEDVEFTWSDFEKFDREKSYPKVIMTAIFKERNSCLFKIPILALAIQDSYKQYERMQAHECN